MKRITASFITFGVVALAASAVQAQTTLRVARGEAAQLPVKGVLAKVNGNVPLTFRVYDRASGGRLIHQESQRVGVQKGVYFAMVGQRAGGLSAELARTPLLWVEVVKEGRILGPRQSFTVNRVGTQSIGLFFASICFTCGGAWPVFAGSIRSVGDTPTERGSSCSGALQARSDGSPFLCTQ
jgi:hypothetical protein